jgi:hypothetical protein
MMLEEILSKPGYLHILINHLPIIGTAMGALALLVALLLRSRPAQITALVVVFVAASSAWPVFVTGQQAYKPVRGLVDDAGSDWLDEHMDRAEKTIYAFYLLAVVALAGLIAPHWWPRTATPLAIASGALSLVCFALAGYIAQPGGRVSHPEFRPAKLQEHAANTLHSLTSRYSADA